MKELYERIQTDLNTHTNKQKALLDKRYHKYAGFESLGISAPLFTTIMKKYKRDILLLSPLDIRKLALLLYKNKTEELVLAGNFVLQQRIEYITKSELPLLDKALDYFCSWSTIDDFCIDVLQPVLLAYPKETLQLLRKWNTSKNMWKRRASVVAFVRKIGASGKFTNEALTLCENLIHDTEDLVQKGVGWCLKDIMRGDKKKVLTYVRELRKRAVPAVITLYAIRDITGTEREEILKK